MKQNDKSKNTILADFLKGNKLQKLQDSFSIITGVASAIIDTNGNYITRPSNDTTLFSKIIPKTDNHFDNSLNKTECQNIKEEHPIIESCLNGNLYKAYSGFFIEKKLIAIWFIGQVRKETIIKEQITNFAGQLKINKLNFYNAVKDLPIMEYHNFEKIVNLLSSITAQLSLLASYSYHKKDLFIQKDKDNSQVEQANTQLSSLNDELIKTQEIIIKSEQKYRTLYNNAQVGMFTTTLNSGIIIEANDKIAKILGYNDQEEIINKINSLDLYENTLEREKLFNELIQKREINNKEILLKKNDKSPFWAEMSMKLNADEEKIEGILVDISKKKEAEDQVFKLTFYDQLTKLPNKEMFKNRLKSEISLSQNFAVICLGMDKFKLINEIHGTQAGDDVLKEIAIRLNKIYFKKDMISRYGSDKFMIILSQFNSLEEVINIENVEKVIIKTKNIFATFFKIDNISLEITPSIGICFYPTDGDNPEALMANSESAMFLAKDKGGNTSYFYDSQLNQQLMQRFMLEHDIQSAIDNEEFIVHYQAKVDKDKNIVGAEALIRWKSPKRKNLIPPYEFIPIAEKNGMIVDIGYYVLKKTCEQNKKWQEMKFAPMQMSVNLSACQFKQNDLIAIIKEILKETNLNPKWLELEITESGIMENEKDAIQKLYELHNLGISISIDDFGTGYSSFSKLKIYPIDTLKIDKSFIDDLPGDHASGTIATSIIDLAHNLGFKVVAEGVETQEQLKFLDTHKCDQYQGYYFYKPIPADELEKNLKKKS